MSGQFSKFAYLDGQGRFFQHANTNVNAGKKKLLNTGFINAATDEQSYLVCAKCCGLKHNECYETKDGKVTSRFQNLAKSTKRCKLPTKKLGMIVESMQRKAAKEGGAPVASASVLALFENQPLKGSSDWIVEFGPNMALLYGCVSPTCSLYPTKSSSWWRCSRIQDTEGGTDQGGFWRCPVCLTKWQWKEDGGAKRLLVIGSVETGYFMSYLGTISPAAESLIHFLKGCVVIKQVAKRELTVETMLQVIEEVNERNDRRLSRFKECGRYVAANPAGFGVKVYCEDARLSLNRPGTIVNCLKIREEDLVPLKEDEIIYTLHLAASLMHVEDAQPADAIQSSVKSSIITSPLFHQVRAILNRRMLEAKP
jgi:hypothetical protein